MLFWDIFVPSAHSKSHSGHMGAPPFLQPKPVTVLGFLSPKHLHWKCESKFLVSLIDHIIRSNLTRLLGPALEVEALEVEWRLHDGVVMAEAAAHPVARAQVHDHGHLVHPHVHLDVGSVLAPAGAEVAASLQLVGRVQCSLWLRYLQ